MTLRSTKMDTHPYLEMKGFKEFTIELKYYEGEPVIKQIARVSTPGPFVVLKSAATAARNAPEQGAQRPLPRVMPP